MSDRNTTELEQELSEYVRRCLAGGFHTRQKAMEFAIEVLSTNENDSYDLLAIAKPLAEKLYQDQLQAQTCWPAITDCDRLDRAFDELNRAGIVSRQNFSCCGTCGAAEIECEMKDEEEKGITVRGYTFYHMQDTESATDGYGLCLNYGSVVNGEEAAISIGHEIVDAMQRNGLKTQWDGSWSKRIIVSLDWKRRMPTETL